MTEPLAENLDFFHPKCKEGVAYIHVDHPKKNDPSEPEAMGFPEKNIFKDDFSKILVGRVVISLAGWSFCRVER